MTRPLTHTLVAGMLLLGTLALSSAASGRTRTIRVGRRRVAVLLPHARPWRGGYPLIVALHGAGSTGRAYMGSFAKWHWRRRVIIAFPTATGRRWRPADEKFVLETVRVLRRKYRVNWRRIYLIGFSRGGTYTYHYGLKRTSPFRALAPIGAGWVPILPTVRKRGTQICLVHGKNDRLIKARRTRRMWPFLRQLHYRVQMRLLSGVGHKHPEALTWWLWRCLERDYRVHLWRGQRLARRKGARRGRKRYRVGQKRRRRGKKRRAPRGVVTKRR